MIQGSTLASRKATVIGMGARKGEGRETGRGGGGREERARERGRERKKGNALDNKFIKCRGLMKFLIYSIYREM